MRGALPIHFEGRDVEVGLRDAHLEILAQRLLDPRLERVRRGKARVEPAAEALEVPGQAPEDRTQRCELVVEVGARSDFLRDDLVELRLRVVGVGDRRGADLEIPLGLRQVFADRRLLALGQLDVEPRQQHVEIGLGDADDQVLLRRRQHEIALSDLLLRL